MHEASATEDSSRNRNRTLALAAAGAVALFAAYWFLPVAAWIESFQEWVRGYGAPGVAIFIVVYAVTAFALVPGSFLTLAAGVIWGLWAFPVVIAGAVLGSAMSFLAARYAFHDMVQRKVSDHPKFAAVNEAIREEGWRVVALLRLSPALPFSLQNWFLGVTPVGFWPAQIATLFGIMPGTLLYVWIGSLGNAAGEGAGTAKFVVLAVGIAATLAVTVIITRKARAKLAQFEG